MSFVRVLITTVLLASIAVPAAVAQDQEELATGKAIPQMPETVWIGEDPDLQGDQVKIYFFWEPSFGLSRLAFPILSDLQERWGTERLLILGLGIEDLQDDDDKPYVRKWVIKQGPRIKFPVGVVQKNRLGKVWSKAVKEPFFFMVMTSGDGTAQVIGNPLSAEVEDYVARLMNGRFDVMSVLEGEAYLKQLQRYRETRDWMQYALIIDRLNNINPKVFAPEQLDFIVSQLTEQGNYDEGLANIDALIKSRATEDPDFLGLLAERLAIDPTIPDDKRPLAAAETAAKESLAAATDGEAKARAMGRLAEVHFKQGKHDIAVSGARTAYRIAPPNIKSEFKERWVDMKRRAAGLPPLDSESEDATATAG